MVQINKLVKRKIVNIFFFSFGCQAKMSHLIEFFLVPTTYVKKNIFMPPPFIMGGGAYSITLVRTSIRTYIRTSRTSCPVRTKNGFRAISFEYICVLDSYFIYRYIIIKYRSSSITDKIHRLLSELWPLISYGKWFPGDIF